MNELRDMVLDRVEKEVTCLPGHHFEAFLDTNEHDVIGIGVEVFPNNEVGK